MDDSQSGRSPAAGQPAPPAQTITTRDGVTITLISEDERWRRTPIDRALCGRLIDASMGVLCEPRRQWARGTAMSIVLTDDGHIRRLNRRFRRLDKATNVLSFPSGEARGAQAVIDAVCDQPELGDIVLAYETIACEARKNRKTIEDHACHLIVHGFLHLLDYDHDSDGAAKEMEALEVAILAELGKADPYCDAPPQLSHAGSEPETCK